MATPRNEPPPVQYLLPMATRSGQPSTRGQCIDGPRPCEWKTCRFHLHAVHDRPGRRWHSGQGPPSIVKAFSSETCALDVADRGEHNRAEVGRLIGLTRERVRQIEEVALGKLRKLGLDVDHIIEAVMGGKKNDEGP